jgi:hypothetical protein
MARLTDFHRQHQLALESVARRGLLVVLGVVADLEGGCPRGTGKLEDLGLITSNASRQGRARVLPSLLDIRGGGSCRSLRGVVLLGGDGPYCALGAPCSWGLRRAG